MRMIDWSSDVCSSDLGIVERGHVAGDILCVGLVLRRRAAGQQGGEQKRCGSRADARHGFRQHGRVIAEGMALAKRQNVPVCRYARTGRSSRAVAPPFAAGMSEKRPFSWQARALEIRRPRLWPRSEEHTSELQSTMRHSYAVFCLKKKKKQPTLT